MKKTLLLLSLLLFVCTAWAGRITEEQAYTIASKFFNNSGMRKAPSDGSVATLRLAQASSGYYAFNHGNAKGFVIVAADDNARAEVLGYSDTGTFRPDSMPTAMKWWLGEYERELAYAAQKDDGTDKTVLKRQLPTYATIEPLLTSMWGQEEPYNALCPSYQKTVCPTGCVATALSQIMYYHKWPEKGSGSHSYDWKINGQTLSTLSADFSQSVYDWNAMTPQYGSTSSQQSKDAVARLMHDVGIASDMQYFPTGSGAYTTTAVQALNKYFNYDLSMELIRRDFYGLAEWQELIYNSLAQGYPVLYSGSTAANEGHAFVCDGYSNGYFHINWGWDGMSNGYFLLTALDPDAQGTGGGTSGYNYDQMVATGIKPYKQGSTIKPLMYCTEVFNVAPNNTTTSSTVTFGSKIYNYSIATISIKLGIKIVDNAGNITYIASTDNNDSDDDLPPLYGYNKYDVSLKQFPKAAGTYKVYPAFRDNNTGTWHDIRSMIYNPQYLVANADGNGIIEFKYPDSQGSVLSVTDMRTTSSTFAGKPFKIKATITNSGQEFFGELIAAVVPTGSYDATALSEKMFVNLPYGESTDCEFTVDAPSKTGNYDIIIIDSDYSIISGRLAINISSAPDDPTALSLLSPITMPDANNASADNIRFTADISCTSGFYADKLYAFVFPYNENKSSTAIISDLFITSGENRTVTFTGSIPLAQVGDKYRIRVYYLNNNTQTAIPSLADNYLEITIGSLTGINGTEADTQAGEIRVYNLAGECVLRQHGAKPDLTSLAPGIYIVKTAGTTKCVAKQ